jgi:HAD superfamily phosphoserine phosphatase-like hydrolase
VKTRGLVVFDLDGTLLRGSTICELLAAPLGHLAEMRSFEARRTEPEIAQARVEMARWYRGVSRERLLGFLESAQWAPGVAAGIARLQQAGMEVAIASVTWDFAVNWVARRLNVAHTLGTRIAEDGTIEHTWPRDKADWLRGLTSQIGVQSERTAAVGDSSGDLAMLQAAGLRFFVGLRRPADLTCIHLPAADIENIAENILAHWA